MNIAAAVKAGVSFMTHKASEGTGYTDTQYNDAAGRARGVVPLFGAYHVLHSGSINAQVDHFLAVLKAGSPWWQSGPFLVQLDCERWATDFPQAGDITAWCNRFMAVTGGTHRPVVYASRGQYGGSLSTVHYPLWNAAYPTSAGGAFRSLYPGDRSSNWATYSGQVPAIWQYTSSATIGTQPTCDANAYRGTLDQLQTLVYLDNSPQEDPVPAGMLIQKSDGTVWYYDGVWRRPVSPAASSTDISYLSANHLGLISSTTPQAVSDAQLPAFGVDVTKLGTATVAITPDQVAQIAQAVVAAESNGLTPADLASITGILHSELGKLQLTVAP